MKNINIYENKDSSIARKQNRPKLLLLIFSKGDIVLPPMIKNGGIKRGWLWKLVWEFTMEVVVSARWSRSPFVEHR